MSQGYKERCLITDNCIAMWSFDGDTFDRVSHLPLQNYIIDEVDNQSPGEVVHEQPSYQDLTVGRPSLITLEQSNQYSMLVGSIGLTTHALPWPKSYIRVPHTNAFSFPEFGSFSVEFVFTKADESAFQTWLNPYYTWSKKGPIIRKKGVFEIRTSIGSYDNLEVIGPLGTATISEADANFFDKPCHVVLVWNVTQVDEFEYSGTQTVYVNNRKFYSSSSTYFDETFPTTNITADIEIGGTSESPIPASKNYDDRNTSKLKLDQVCIYGYGLTEDTVTLHYRKIHSYRDMVLIENPKGYWDFADEYNETISYVVPDVGTVKGYFRGSVYREVAGPTQLTTATCMELSTNSYFHFETLSSYSCYTPYSSLAADYSLDFWFNCASGNSSTIWSQRGITSGTSNDGLDIMINTYDNSLATGAIQVRERRGVQIQSYGEWNDGKWHHLAVTRSSSRIVLYIDGEIITSQSVTSRASVGSPGQMFVGGDGYTTNTCSAPLKICQMAFYDYTMTHNQVKARANYETGYEIKGVVTYQGNPIQAQIRFYRSNTGVLVKEIESDVETGEYRAEFLTNSNMDILVFDKYNRNVRYRAFGPVAPSSFEDLPISL